MKTTLPFPAATPYPRALHLWEPEGSPRALVLLAHGMAEHIDRYEGVGVHLAQAGYLVAGYNMLGHGPEAPLPGWFAPADGWGRAVADLRAVMAFLEGKAPGKQRVLLGHSMGSFLAREYALRHPDGLDALVLSGTAWQPAALCRTGLLISQIQCALGMEKKASRVLDSMAFSANNKPFAQAGGTAFDWLSRDKAEVAAYVADPLCGFPFTAGGFRDLFRGLLALTRPDRLKALPDKLPVHLLSGRADPLALGGKGIETVAGQYQNAGLTDVTVRLYEGARHELFHETNKAEVLRDLTAWLDSRVGERKEPA